MVKQRDIWHAVHRSPEGIIIDILASPGAKRQEIKGYNPWRERVELAICSPPEKGKANKEILQFFTELLDVEGTNIRVYKGHTSRNKSLIIGKGAGTTDPEVVVETIYNAIQRLDRDEA